MLTRLSVYIPRKSEKSTESRNKLRVLIERYKSRKGKRLHFNNTTNSVGKTAVSNRTRQIPEEKQRVATERHEIRKEKRILFESLGIADALADQLGSGPSTCTSTKYRRRCQCQWISRTRCSTPFSDGSPSMTHVWKLVSGSFLPEPSRRPEIL